MKVDGGRDVGIMCVVFGEGGGIFAWFVFVAA